MRIAKIAVAGALVLGLAACEGQYGPKQTGGALVGGALGGLAGSQIGSGTGSMVATGLGVALGLLAGGEVGKSLDRADQMYLNRTTSQALETYPSGQTATWRNPDSGHYGTVTPRPAYQTAAGQYCREFTQTVVVGGQQQQAYGTACRQPDGTWKIVQ